MEYIPAKTIVTRTKNTDWFGTDYNMNIYKGCCHGCIYCDSRSECYRVGDFDTVRAKENALEIIRDDLRRRVKTGVIGTGSMSDPYNPFELELALTRHALELIEAYEFGVAIATKSALVVRDTDILKEIGSRSPVLVKLTVTAASDELSRRVEPYAPPSSERFAALGSLAKQGIFAGVLMMPVLPFLEDSEENVLEIVRRASQNGARFVYPFFGVTLRANQREWFYQKLEECFPGQGVRRQYEQRFGGRYACQSPHARRLYELFASECERLGLLYQMQDIIRAYHRGHENDQLSLFT